MMHKGVVVDDTEFLEQRDQLFAGVPGRRCIALRLFAGKVGHYFDGFCEYVSLL